MGSRVMRPYTPPDTPPSVLGKRGRKLRQDGACPPALEQSATLRSTPQEKMRDGRFVMSANAVAGAIAGTLVSITLHPIDTIKVTIQAERSARQPIAKVIAQMLSKRGVLGLYSGLTTSLASSAPISAIYTASYEGVKAKLLPMFPEVRRLSHNRCGNLIWPYNLLVSNRRKNGSRIAWRADVRAWRPRLCTPRRSASSRGARSPGRCLRGQPLGA